LQGVTRKLLWRERRSLLKIYVGNLSRDVTEAELQSEFEAFGKVDSVSIVMDKYSGQPRGFGFVEMPTKAEGQAAIEGLKGKVLNQRTIVVNESRPRSEGERGGRPYDGGRGGGFGGRGKPRRY
jgi:RNA recognition motif-containing protein